jgi:hypothetical protein
VYVECEAVRELLGRDLAESESSAETLVRAVVALQLDEEESEGSSHAILAQQHHDKIDLVMVRAVDAFSVLVNVLPAFSGHTRSIASQQVVKVPVAALKENSESPVYFSRGTELGYYHRELSQVRAIQAQPVVRAGQLSIRKRDNQGRLHRGGGGSWFVTDKGGYFGAIEPGPGGDWLTVLSVDAPTLTAKLAELAYQSA